MRTVPGSPGRILVGTASWSDPGFVKEWYPSRLPAGDRLAWYASHFEMVEVNSTFYAVPSLRLVERWCRTTPDGFVFNVKLHQLLSRHAATAKMLPPALQKKAVLTSTGKVELTEEMEEALVAELAGPLDLLAREQRLGALLLQLSPAFSPRRHSLDELDHLLGLLRGRRLVVELRHRDWVTGDQAETTVQFFRARGATLAFVDTPDSDHFTVFPREFGTTTSGDLGYLRLHGRNAKAYLTGRTVGARFDYDYNAGEISEIRDRVSHLAGPGREVHVVFNNNNLDYAPRAALRLREALGQIAAAGPEQGRLFPREA